MVQAAVADFGFVDILIHNAGLASRGRNVAETDPAELARVVATHAFGPHYLSKLVLPTQGGYTNNYFITNSYDTTYHKIDAKVTFNPGPRLNLNGRLGFLPSWERTQGAKRERLQASH